MKLLLRSNKLSKKQNNILQKSISKFNISNTTLLSFSNKYSNNVKLSDTFSIEEFVVTSRNATNLNKSQKYKIQSRENVDANKELSYNTSFTQLIDKYFLSAKNKILNTTKEDKQHLTFEEELDTLIYNISKEEIFKNNYNKDLLKENLSKYVHNCVKYNFTHYLDSCYFFNNNNYKTFLDESVLEKDYQFKNPKNYTTKIISELSIKDRYNEILNKYESSQVLPLEVERKHDQNIYKLRNFLSSLSSVKASYDLLKKKDNNKNLLENKKDKLLISYETDSLRADKAVEAVFLHKLFFNKLPLKLQEDGTVNKEVEEAKAIINSIDSVYPGNDRGPSPKDDIEHFHNWFRNNHTKEQIKALDTILSFKKRSYQNHQESIKKYREYKNENEKPLISGEDLEEIVDDNIIDVMDDQGRMNLIESDYFDKGLPERDYFQNDDFVVFDGANPDPLYAFDCDTKIIGQFLEETGEEDEEPRRNRNHFYGVNSCDYKKNNLLSFIPPKMNLKFHEAIHNFTNWNGLIGPIHTHNYFKYIKEAYLEKQSFDYLEDCELFFNKVNEKYQEKIAGENLLAYLELYPDSVKNHPTIKIAVQSLMKYQIFMSFTLKTVMIDILSTLIFELSERDSQKGVNLYSGQNPLPRTIRNAKRLYLVDWKKYMRPERKIDQDPELDESGDEEMMIAESMQAKLDEEKEEEERQEKKKAEAAEKRALEEAKNQSKEAYDALKKKIEDEKKAKEKEEIAREEDLELELDQEEDFRDDASYSKEERDDKEAEEKREFDAEPEDQKKELGFDEFGRLTFSSEQFDYNYTMNPQIILGENEVKKHLVQNGLPKLSIRRFEKDPERNRYIELHKKMTKLIITKEEEKELLALLSLRDTDPYKYSKITGITIKEIRSSQKQRKSFTDTYFKDGHDLRMTEGELKLIEKETKNLDLLTKSNEEEDGAFIEKGTQRYIRPIADATYAINPHTQEIPIDFYDNDDGFWDDYIEHKYNRLDLTKLKFKPFHFSKHLLAKNEDI